MQGGGSQRGEGGLGAGVWGVVPHALRLSLGEHCLCSDNLPAGIVHTYSSLGGLGEHLTIALYSRVGVSQSF